MRCVFCEKPEIKDRMIVENDLAWAFPTNIPVVPGHVLICPKSCTSSIEDLTIEERNAIFDLMGILKKSLIKSFGAEGFNHAWNESKSAGQSVPHLHLHVLPRKTGDTGINEYEPRKFLYRPGSRSETPEDELKEVVKIIKANL